MSNPAHFQSVCRGYGPIVQEVEHGETYDVIHVAAWNVTLKAFREPTATEPNYEMLACAGWHAGVGLTEGIERGRKLACAEIRKAMGIPE